MHESDYLARFRSSYVGISVIALIMIISLQVFFAKYSLVDVADGMVPAYLLMPLTVFVSILLDKHDLKVLLVLIVLEAFTVFAEYYTGVSTFFPSLERYRLIGESELFYYNKPLGLSANSSVVALKLFIGYMLLELFRIRTIIKVLLQGILLAAIFLTFNRTVFLAIGCFIALKHLLNILRGKFTMIRWSAYLSLLMAAITGGLLFVTFFWDEIVLQLTRESGIIELSGRDKIWAHYLYFIRENIWFGNFGLKYYFGEYHAHNSMMQVLATNGILVTLIYCYFILRGIHIANAPYVIAILCYSFFQYGIFWGISLLDIVFFYFLFQMKERSGEESEGIGLSRSIQFAQN